MAKNNIPFDRYCVELFDEPEPREDDETVLAVCRRAHEAVPRMDIQLIFSCKCKTFSVDYLHKLIPYVKSYCFRKGAYTENIQ